MNDRGNALKAHSGVHVFGGERRKGAIFIGIVLDEHKVPDFNALTAVGIYKAAFRAAFGREVDVQFTAGTTRAGVAHHPKVILFVAVNNVHGGVEPGGGENFRPITISLLVELARVAITGLVHGGVQAFLGEPPSAGDQLPRPLNGLFFEVITKRPVAEHFEESVVIGIHPHIVEVVVFAAGANTLLRISGAAGVVRAVSFAEKNRHKLIHAGVGKQQVRRIGHQTRARYNGVLSGLKEIQKILPNLTAGSGGLIAHHWAGTRLMV